MTNNNNNNSPLKNFNDVVTTFVINSILQPLSKYLEDKDIKITVEEMINVLNITKSDIPIQTYINVDNNNMAQYIRSLNSNETKPQNKETGRTRRKNKNNLTSFNTCKYVFRYAKRQGEVCGDICEPGKDYCKSCLKKAYVKQMLLENEKKINENEDTNKKSPIKTEKNNDNKKDKTELNDIELVMYSANDGLFIETNYNYIGRTLPGDIFLAEKILENDIERPLTDEEKKTANSRGISTLKT